MTCIVGIVEQGAVYLGGDTALSSESWQITTAKRSKLFRCGEMIFGSCGSVRISQLLEHAFKPPPITEPLATYMVVDFVAALKTCLKEDGQKAEDLLAGAVFLVGIRGRLFVLYSDFQVSEIACNYYAVGAADSEALGSLYTTASLALPAKQRLTLALNAAHAHHASVRPPFTYISTKEGACDQWEENPVKAPQLIGD